MPFLLDLTACLAIAVSSATVAACTAYPLGHRIGWRRGFDQGYGDALAISALSKPIQDRADVVADPAPRVVGEGCRPAAEVYPKDDVAFSNIAPVSPEVASNVLSLHVAAPLLREATCR